MIDGIPDSRNLHEPGGDRGLTVEKYRSDSPGVTLSGLAGGQFLRLRALKTGLSPYVRLSSRRSPSATLRTSRSAEPLGLPSAVNAPFGLC
jgi:hypothetical protein